MYLMGFAWQDGASWTVQLWDRERRVWVERCGLNSVEAGILCSYFNGR